MEKDGESESAGTIERNISHPRFIELLIFAIKAFLSKPESSINKTSMFPTCPHLTGSSSSYFFAFA